MNNQLKWGIFQAFFLLLHGLMPDDLQILSSRKFLKSLSCDIKMSNKVNLIFLLPFENYVTYMYVEEKI